MAQIDHFIQSAWLHLRADRPKQAMDCVKKAHAISPNSPDVSHLLGLLASRDGKPEVALPLLQKAIDTGGKTSHRLRHVGEALLSAGYPEAAIMPIQDAISVFGESSDLLGLKSAIEIGLECWDDAINTAKKAIALNPNLLAWELNLSIAQLMQLNLEEGFKNATARLENLKFGAVCPALKGAKPSVVWLKGEQGIGDTLFFLRYIPSLVNKGWQFHLEVDKKLVPILQATNLFLTVKDKNKCPAKELCLSMGDLPLMAMQCGLNGLPPPLALVPDAKLVDKLKLELAKFGPPPYIAVSWRGGPKGLKHRAGIRSLEKLVEPSLLGRALRESSATIVCIQRLPEIDEFTAFEQALGRKCADYTALNNNLSGMLALLSIVDEYVTVSNTNLHLREALSKPSKVFVNKPFQDWRWRTEGEESVWYPASVVFCQLADKSWGNAFEKLAESISHVKSNQDVGLQAQPSAIVNAPSVQNPSNNENNHDLILKQGWEVVTTNIPEAIAKARLVLESNPKNARALHLLGWAAMQDLKFDLGISVLGQAVQLEPNNGNIWRDYIRAHVVVEKPTEAIQIALECLKNPNLWAKGVVYYGLGTAYSLLEDDINAIENYEKCLKLIPNHLDAATFAGLCCLRLGDDYARKGFRYNTARAEARNPSNFQYWVCPVLKGDITGLKILVLRSMGYGDELSYLRYLPYLIKAGAKITYWAGVKLAPLLARLPYEITVIPDTEPIPDTNNFDLTFIKTELPVAVEHLGAPEIADSLPLMVDPKKLEYWKEWLAAKGPAPYIGITWRAGVGGNVKDGFSYSRLSKKIEQEDFAKSLSGINATWVSLQRNITKSELVAFENLLGYPVIDVAGITDDLDDLLCIQSLLAENIGVSNTNMHLRGCLGLGSRVLVSVSSRDWRWGVSGDYSTWFKDCKIYRQTSDGDWSNSLNTLRNDLIELYGLSNNKRLVNSVTENHPISKNKKIIWVTAGEVKNRGQELYSPLSSAQERVVSIAKMLADHGWKSEFLNESVSELMGGWHDKLPVNGDVVVFSKVFTDHAITLMKDAKLRGARVVFDVFNDFAELTQRGIHQQKLLESSDIVISCPKMQSKWERNGQPIAFYFENINDELPKEKKLEILKNWLDVLENNQILTGKIKKEAVPQKANINIDDSSSQTNRLIWFTAGDIKNIEGKNTSNLASARYRVISPINALTTMGWQSEIVNESAAQAKSGWGESSPRAGDTVIISKVFTHHGVIMAKDAKSRGAKVIVDMCDNFLTHPKYGVIQHELLACADAVVTATESLKDAFIQVGKKVDAVISDPVEFQRGDIKFSPNNILNILWFGHPVNIDTLSECLPSIALLSQSIPLKLQVVTNLPNGQQDLDTIVPKGLNANYISWSVSATEKAIADCDLVIIPTVHNDFKNAKSPNRLLEPLWAGRMVVAGPIPAYQPFGDSAWIGKDIVEGIKWCLANPKEVVKRIAQGQADIEKYFTEQAIGLQWEKLLNSANEKLNSQVLSFEKEAKKAATTKNVPANTQPKLVSVVILSTQTPILPSIGIRLIEPLSLLQDKVRPQLAVKIENQRMVIDDAALEKADVVIVQRDFPFSDTIARIKELKSKGKTIIYETDDAFHLLDTKHNKSHHLACAPWINECIELADVITVSTPALAKQFSHAERVVCIPNKLSPTLWNQRLLEHAHKVRQSLDAKQIRIGIIAGGNHEKDIEFLDEVIQKVTNTYPNVVWVGYGDAASVLFSSIPNNQKQTIKSNWNYRNHPFRIAELGIDIMLAPLEDTPFNACISNLKFIESGFLEVPCIMSDVAAFNESAQHGKDGILVKNNTAAWFNAIQTLIENPSLRASLGKSARQTVLNNYMLSHSSEWLEILKKPEVNKPVSRFKAYNSDKSIGKIGLLTNQKLELPSVNLRLVQPLEQIGLKAIIVASHISDTLSVDYESLFHFDTLIVQRDFPSAQAMPLLNKLKALGKKLIYEADDAFHLIPEHHSKAFHRANAPAIFEFVKLVDAITVSTEALANEFKPYGNVKVLPNRLSPTLWNDALLDVAKQHRAKHDSKQIRIGLIGGADHQLDLALLEQAIKAIVKANPDIEWVGYGDGAVALLKPLVQANKLSEIKTNLDYRSHPARVTEMALDIALVPLIDDSFNQCRSNLKFLEFGFLGVPCVFSNTPSYNQTVVDGETGLLVNNSSEHWVKAIQSLIDNPALRINIGVNAQKEVQTNWMLNSQNNGWHALLDDLK
jgi:glycosyltransferase involved in cell wall biosynthesis/tetratricopeptide (TPR) repeat protein